MVDGSILKTIVLIGKALVKIYKKQNSESVDQCCEMTFNFSSTDRIRNPETYIINKILMH